MTVYVVMDHEGKLQLVWDIKYVPSRWTVWGKFKLEEVADE